MAEKISKTARASLGTKGSAGGGRSCPQCGSDMVATRIVRSVGLSGGMYWICQNDDYRIRTK